MSCSLLFEKFHLNSIILFSQSISTKNKLLFLFHFLFQSWSWYQTYFQANIWFRFILVSRVFLFFVDSMVEKEQAWIITLEEVVRSERHRYRQIILKLSFNLNFVTRNAKSSDLCFLIKLSTGLQYLEIIFWLGQLNLL